MSTSKKSPIKRTQGKEPSRLEVYFCVNFSEILTYFAKYSKRIIKKLMRLVQKIALILIVFQLLDRPAVVVPENTFVVSPATAPHIAIKLTRQLDEPLISRRYSGLEHIRHSQVMPREAV